MARWGKLRGSFYIRTRPPFLVGMSAQLRTAPDSARTMIPSRTLPENVSPNTLVIWTLVHIVIPCALSHDGVPSSFLE